METTTYSFAELSGAIAHPSLGAYVFQGQGTGSVSIAPQTEKSTHDRASDGSIMVSKIAGNNAIVTISVQQTSELDAWLQNAFNLLNIVGAAQWAQMSATLRNSVTQRTHVLNGLSFQKEPDQPYQAQGQQRTWNLMCAEHINLTV